MSSSTVSLNDQTSGNLKNFIFIDKKFDSITGKENKENLIKW